jgi:hypothetical protein
VEIAAVGGEVALVCTEPASAVAATWIVAPRSAPVTGYDAGPADPPPTVCGWPTSAHVAAHRCHWYWTGIDESAALDA